jgi:serine/threonine protein kinase HipA of HipAB toxin-antitoxin module
MTDEFEQALRRALRPRASPEGFDARLAARLDAGVGPRTPAPRHDSMLRHALRSRWLPAALAACLIAAAGLVQLRRHELDAARANQARTQLLQALSIASDNVNIVRAAVAREESPDS